MSHTTCVRRSPMRGGDRRRIGRGGAEPVGDRRQYERRIPERCERNEDRSSFCVVAEQTRQLDREPRLAGAARTDDREDPRISLVHQRDGVEQLLLAAEERRRRSRKVDASRCPERRELALAELVEANRAIEVLEPVLPQVAERLRVEQRGSGRREQNLVAVRERRDARAAMHVQPDVPLGRRCGDASVQAHPNAHRTGVEPVAGVLCGGCCSFGRRESDEERVTLGVDLDSAVLGRRLTHDPPMLCERFGVPSRAELVQQSRRPLDVGEEERDRSFGKRAHFPNDYAEVVPNQRLRRAPRSSRAAGSVRRRGRAGRSGAARPERAAARRGRPRSAPSDAAAVSARSMTIATSSAGSARCPAAAAALRNAAMRSP